MARSVSDTRADMDFGVSIEVATNDVGLRRYVRMRTWAWICIATAFLMFVGISLLADAILHIHLSSLLTAAVCVPIGMFGSFLIVRSASLRDSQIGMDSSDV